MTLLKVRLESGLVRLAAQGAQVPFLNELRLESGLVRLPRAGAQVPFLNGWEGTRRRIFLS
jgi:hypothetical protein